MPLSGRSGEMGSADGYSVLMKVLSIPLTLIMFTLLFGASNELASYMGGSAIVQWIGVIGSIVATYKFGRWFVN